MMTTLRPCTQFILIPFAYLFLVKSFKKYYLNNDLRFLYKQDILVPWLRRIDDHQCSDKREALQELQRSTQIDEAKSLVRQQFRMLQNKGKPEMQTDSSSYGRKQQETQAEQSRGTNLNLIKRQ